jgi:hypothetical protein
MKPFKLSLIALLMGLATLLTACGDGLSLSTVNFTVQTEPNPLVVDINVTDTGLEYVNTSHVFSFASRSGALGARIEGYDIEFYDSSGNPVFFGDSGVRSSGSLSVYMPGGLTCDELKANLAFDNCTINSAGASFAPGPVRSGPTSYLVAPDIAIQLFQLFGNGGAVGAYALVYFYGTDDIGRPFRTSGYQYSLIII